MRLILLLLVAVTLTLMWQTTVLATDVEIGPERPACAAGQDNKQTGEQASGDDEPECE
jgi:hypothetical protein